MTNYQLVWEELQRRAQDAFDEGDTDRWIMLAEASERLREWLDAGRDGPCPVDLESLGIPSGSAERDVDSTSGGEKVAAAGAASEAVAGETEDSNAAAEAETSLEESPSPQPLESPEQAALHRQLQEAQAYFGAGRWREAVGLSEEIAGRTKDAALRDAAEDLQARARAELEIHLNQALEAGDKARLAGEDDAARRHYDRALDLDPENVHARRALLELEERPSDEEKNARLRAQLKKRRNVQKLGDAIYRAEAMDAEGRLDAETQQVLRQARAWYNDIRKEMGQATTMIRFSDLDVAFGARKKARDWLAEGQEKVWDATTNKYVDTDAYNLDADKHLKEKSKEVAQYELDIANRNLPAYPEVAIQRIEKALKLPLHEDHKKTLQEKLDEANRTKVQKEKAEEQVRAALKESEPSKRFAALLQAKREFPHLESLNAHLEAARREAEEDIHRRVVERHRQAERALRPPDAPENYRQAERVLAEAEALIGQWPAEEKPAALSELLEAGNTLRKKLQDREKLYNTYLARAKEIREKVKDPDHRRVARQLFEELKQNADLTQFTDFATLRSEMDQYAEVGELLEEARRAKKGGDWERVYELTSEIQERGQAGELKDEVNTLAKEASEELDIARAQGHLRNKEIVEANMILSRLLGSVTPERKKELEARLKDERAQIQQAIDADKEMRPVFERGLAELGLLGDARLKVFLHHELNWERPASKIEGIARAELKQMLAEAGAPQDATVQQAMEAVRGQLLEHLRGIAPQARVRALRLFRHVQGETWQSVEVQSEEEEKLPPYRLSLRTAEAGRMARLLRVSLRDDVLQEIKQAYADRDAREWDDETITMLSKHARLLREAGLLEGDEDRQASRWFQLQRGKRLANEYESLGEWGDAERIWDELAISLPGDEDVRSSLIRVRKKKTAIQKVLEEMESARQAKQYRKALQIISNGMKEVDDPSLRRELEKTLRLARTDLVALAQEEGSKNNTASISRAVLALLELQELEKEAGISEDECVAGAQLEQLKQRVKQTRPNFASVLPELGRLYQILHEADAFDFGSEEESGRDNQWIQAVRKNNFEDLRNYDNQIKELNLNLDDVPDYVNFVGRLEEWKEINENLRRDLVKVSQYFEDEKYDEVVKLLRRNSVMPSERGNGKPFRYMTPPEYARIRAIISNSLRVMDAYGEKGEEELVGWDEAAGVAEQRLEELALWQEWKKNWQAVVKDGAQWIDNWKDVGVSGSLVERQEVLEEIIGATLKAIRLLNPGGPLRDGKPILPGSRETKQMKEEGARALDVAETQLKKTLEELAKVVKSIYDLGGFPTVADFGNASQQAANGDCKALEQLLQRAKQIGCGSSVLLQSQFRYAVAQARRRVLEPLMKLLSCTDRLQVQDDFPRKQKIDAAIQKINGADSNTQREVAHAASEFNDLLEIVEKGFDFLGFLKDAKQQALERGEYAALERFLKYSAETHSICKPEEQAVLKLYENTLEQVCNTKSSGFWKRLSGFWKRLFER